MFSFVFLMHMHTRYLGSVSVPAQVLREAVEADVVGLTLRPRRAEGQAVIVLLHLLHLQQHTTHTHTRMTLLSGRLTRLTPTLHINDNLMPAEIES